ncbi:MULTISPECIES: carbon-nitrogen hydrolase family protein [unclassified Mesorhizobium]|uniref:carbon-nitrogen hydrolase family protein n=1 Tax=unclassified Mesorhizobium TaxID=325217 RepID=UPI000F76177D|nr:MULTISPECIES: carbon-nitrogen hydrolase family protein [unclassified Mesorhizobium]RUU47555.1 carbon-nitrogen hydrolase family protein [Mesorhizobium sp. M6A.T.Ca.TU.002.02.2.1]AZO64675.1 carbon-nitrogen hydrolase family protein [Mesorhizobium sp. M6A.T.Cr.TU.016.01.1.1]RUU42206.1 carbon-nitrogen hydrolase family protein [Mesorhizobium sp. M6A.T.Ce.TU.002.03.1.1]RWO93831.1 MAG: carbon-nitrogen hydrolase family protein [Mesorhizobium sp.]RWP46951.1 MAG: carbon-nitrogen hydrolase family prote
MTRIAIVQEPPAFLDREGTIAKAVRLVAEAANGGAELVVFSEAFIPGYPAWIWRLKPGADGGLAGQLHGRLVDNAVDLSSDQLRPLFDAARTFKVTILCGINERDSQWSRATIYNSVIVIGPDGSLLNRHRKLMPTNPERMVWGFGDASGLKVVDTPSGRVGSLVCWENYMPLARYALYAQGIDIHVAPTYDSGDGWIGTLQHIAREGGCWVIGAGNVLRVEDLPRDFPDRDRLYPDADEWINQGDSVVIAPGGKIVAGPLRKETGILHADIDLKAAIAARRSLDVAGHYSRPDIFTLQVNAKSQRPAEFSY